MWRRTEVSTAEEIFEEIKELPQPLAIILFDDTDSGELKNQCCAQFKEGIPNLDIIYGNETFLHVERAPFDAGCNVLVVASNELPNGHKTRRQLVMTLKELGAKTVIGFYVKDKLPTLKTDAKVLAIDLPVQDKFDYFYVATKKEV